MKQILVIIAVLVVGCEKKDIPEPQANTPEIPKAGVKDNSPSGLLKEIHSLAQKEDYDKLNDCIFPFSNKKLPSLLIEGIKEKKKRGDGAYTHKALKTLIDNHLGELKPAAGKALEYCVMEGNGGFGEDKRVAEIAKNRPQDITMFDFGHANILIIKFEGEHKLLFWENLTRLSGEEGSANEGPSPTDGDKKASDEDTRKK
jgi:hypothetical protein